MTIGGWILFFVLCGCITVITLIILYFAEAETRGLIIGIIVIVAACASLFAGMSWYYKNSESGKRAFKTQESDLHGGIRRHVSVYDAVGQLLQEWDGKFDVDYNGDEQRVLFDDENGFRHIVYFKTGTVIVEEEE